MAWVIGAADELVGFNIYRSTQENEGFMRINEVLIPADKGNEYLDREFPLLDQLTRARIIPDPVIQVP